jgi:hypothetical protein
VKGLVLCAAKPLPVSVEQFSSVMQYPTKCKQRSDVFVISAIVHTVPYTPRRLRHKHIVRAVC